MSFDRRAFVGGALALGACSPAASDPILASSEVPALKHIAPAPIGTCVQVSHLDDPQWVDLAKTQCSQLTPEWEMKMEYVLRDDGALRFDRGDRIAAFAQANAMGLYGTTLVWYAQRPAALERVTDRAAFARAFDDYLTAVVTRYRGAVGWDVVNEAVAEDGDGWRESLWSDRLGPLDHMVRAFKIAKAADPQARLFINDYNLETLPRKLDTFQRLVERLLAAGAPVEGIGCQSHLAADLPSGAFERTLRSLARFGLPIHVSELDVSLVRAERRAAPQIEQEMQARIYEEAAAAFVGLPRDQRFALTLWGLRDKDSWLKRENRNDAPAPYDDLGRAKLAAVRLAKGLTV